LFSQLVSMEIPVGGDIGDEVHTVDQVLIFTSGEGRATVAGKNQVSLPSIHSLLGLEGGCQSCCWCWY
jgi:hypothetical protein